MAAPALHSDQIGLNQIVGENINLAGQIGLLTDANVNSSTTFATLYAFLATNAALLHADQQGYLGRIQTAFNRGFDDGTLTDANVNASTTIAALVALTQAASNKVGPILE